MFWSLLFLLSVFVIKPALANPACAVCTIAVGASLEIARRLGVDDSVVGVWAGAFLVLLGYWTIKWFDRKKWNFYGRDTLLLVLSVAMIGFVYLGQLTYHSEVIGIFYLDPFLFSTIIGAVVLVLSAHFYQWMKAKNGGHAHFPFEKVVVPVLSLTLASLYFYYYPICRPAADALYNF